MIVFKIYSIFMLLSILLAMLWNFHKDHKKNDFIGICLFIPILMYVIMR